tara:strand:- start:843 stop:3755 length:2913 start_codon:yes stop_codon:yes gene_type:complete
MNRLFKLFFILLYFHNLSSQTIDPLLSEDFLDQKKWVDSIYNGLSLDEKIGQLFFVQATSKTENNSEKILNDIKNFKIGGLIFSTGHPSIQANLTNKYQNISDIPLLISMDAEWGIGMRIDSVPKFPWNMSLGAIKNNLLVEEIGEEIGNQFNRLGIHMNFAPVIDINTNPKNPIIGNRSFGESKINVSNKGISFTRGIQSKNILATAKHFPGHGDTSKDSHLTLPTIDFDKKRIYDVELYPFKQLIDNGLAAIMIAHLNIPSMEKADMLPSTLSKNIIENTLIKKLNFKGLIITDALEMKGVSDYSKKNIDLMAFLAGNDILLMSSDISKGIKSIKKAYKKGKISDERLSRSVKKILMAKYLVGLNKYKPVKLDSINNDLNTISTYNLISECIENIPTLLKNTNNSLPVKLNSNNILNIQFGNDDGIVFNNYLNKFKKVESIKSSSLNNNQLIELINKYETIIVSIHMKSDSPWENMNKKFSIKEIEMLKIIEKHQKKILISFTNPYMLTQLNLKLYNSIIISYQNNPEFQKITAQQVFGAKELNGSLPVSINSNFKEGDGIFLDNINILSYDSPESVGLDIKKLSKIDSIINYAIEKEMTPGAQILVAKNSKIIYDKSFGKLRYNKVSKTDNNTIYDLASLTKILVTTPIVINLVDRGVISLNTRLEEIISRYKTSNKSKISIKELLSGHAGLQAWIPFYKLTLDNDNKPSSEYYTFKETEFNKLEVSSNLYLRTDYIDTIRNVIRDSDLLKEKYKYSDLSYLIIQEFIEDHYGKNLDQIIDDLLFSKLGVDLTYNPYQKYNTKNIAPTEIDEYFRFREINGYVHDMSAAMFGGVSAHAGLFGNTNNVAKVMQMYLQGGNYANQQILNTETINLFNICYYCDENNRRGVGFDKPQLEDEGPTCNCVSMKSFGHSGWTGTFAWADPEHELIYIFLSNRSYPGGETASESKLVKENIRSKIQEVIYSSIK